MKLPFLLVPALVLLAAPAAAATLQYTLSGTDLDGTVEFARFRLPTDLVIQANNVGVDYAFRIKNIPGVFQYGSTVNTLRDVQFFNGLAGGGFIDLDPTDSVGSSLLLTVTGPQLYTGPEATPTLFAGSFTVFDGYSGAPLSLEVAQVPEPATWITMALGFGAGGAALRRRRRVPAAA